MHIHYLSEENSVLNHFLGQIRNVDVHTDSMRFRRNIERIGEIMAYELSKVTLNVEIQTPLGIKKQLKYKINCFCVPFYVPVYRCTWALNYFDNAKMVLFRLTGTILIMMITLIF
jgi:uracil phosphoribosyltransferase